MRKNIVYWGCLAATLLSSWFWQNAASQEREERKPQKPESAGVATGAPHAPGHGIFHRSVTRAGCVDPPPPIFVPRPDPPGFGNSRHPKRVAEGTRAALRD